MDFCGLGIVLLQLVAAVCGFLAQPDSNANPALPHLAQPNLKIGSFNIQVFGQAKYHNKIVVNILLKILSRYDVVQILEIRDIRQTAFENLKHDLNNHMHSTGSMEQYSSVVSGRLGRTSSKEQYGFLYRTSRVNVTSTYQYVDVGDRFEREPFGVRFSSPSTEVQDFALVAVHVQPSHAVEEIDNLTRVYEAFYAHWNLSDVIIAGDFNSDCQYLSPNMWSTISFRNDARFTWLVDDKMDTTVAASFCVYDRFVVGGSALVQAVEPGSVKAYRFDEELGLDKATTRAVSDHYPIEMDLRGATNTVVQVNLQSSVSFTVTDTYPVSDDDIRAVYRSPSCAGSNFTVKVLRGDTHMDHVTVSFNSTDLDSVLADLQLFASRCPGTLSPSLMSTVRAYLQSSIVRGNAPDVYGLVVTQNPHPFPVEISCSLISPDVCAVTVTRPVSE